PARCSMPGWCTSTPGCPSTIRPLRYGSPTCVCTPTTRRWSPRWRGHWWKPRPAAGRQARPFPPTASRCCAWPPGGAARRGRRPRPPGGASRSGLDDVLLDPRTGLPAPAPAVANTLLEHVRDALDEAGGTQAATELLNAVR